MNVCRTSAAVFLSLLLASQVASAAGGDESRALEAAKKAFDAGVEQFRKGDNEGARILFAQSYAAFPAVETLRDLAVAELNSDHTLDAIGHFKQYARDRNANAEFVKARLPAFLARCNQRLGHLRLSVAPEVAVRVDGRRVTDTTDILDVEPGEHIVDQGPSSGRTQTVRVAAGQTLDVQLLTALTEAPTLGPGTTKPPPKLLTTGATIHDGEGGDTTTWWTGAHVVAVSLVGVAVTGVVVGVGSTLAASSNQSDVDAIRASASGGSCAQAQCAAINDKIDAARRDSTIGDVSFALAGAAALGAAGLLILAEPRSAPVRTGSLWWTPTIGPASVGVVGSF
jgi:hypothetical protein